MMHIGNGPNLRIYNDCNLNKSNVSNLGFGNSYEVPAGMQPDSAESYKYLAGEKYFTVEEIELFKLIW